MSFRVNEASRRLSRHTELICRGAGPTMQPGRLNAPCKGFPAAVTRTGRFQLGERGKGNGHGSPSSVQ